MRTIEEIKSELSGVRATMHALEAELNEARIVAHNPPFKVGDVVTRNGGTNRYRITRLAASDYSVEVRGTRIKKDGTDSANGPQWLGYYGKHNYDVFVVVT